MNLIFVSDIFGKTKELYALCESLKSPFEIVDPYSGKEMNFNNEMEAYEYFMNNIGIQTYSQRLKELIGKVVKSSVLIGFSIGATAIWSISENLNSNIFRHSFCFYSSQIRNYTSVTPCTATELIFPCFEPNFSVPEVSDRLAKKKNVTVHNTAYLHGFMNKLSPNFSQDGYREYKKWLISSIR